ATFPSVYGNRPDHIARACDQMKGKYVTPDQLRQELMLVKSVWPELSAKMKAQIMPFEQVRENLRLVGAPYEPEMVGVSRARFRETYRGVAFMRNRYFALDLVMRLGLFDELERSLFGVGGVWEVKS
ncbi:MAG: sn-glycerol-1-phosphate dehydrogenase, partial [Kiritimatiellae bacterium]|nr:sn-glycerol-1-phosphate dehydrogenase [Kiritimatiellia bacterium]